MPTGTILRVEGRSDFYISPNGGQIAPVTEAPSALDDLDRQILVGPALVLALALRSVWSLHASAVLHRGRVLLFLGESGQGKSTLAAYLASTLPRVADDILPVTMSKSGLTVWPRFPQLKLPADAQPGASQPEQLAAGWVCALTETDPASPPTLERLPIPQATQTILRHTAGTRLFPADLLTQHLGFCAQAAHHVPAYQLYYPRRMDALPLVKECLQNLQ